MRQSGICLLVLVGTFMIGACGALAQSGGTSSETAQAPPNGPVGGEGRPARVSGGVMAGLLLNKVQPAYPQNAKDAKVSGTVVMVAKIDKTGKVVDLKVVSGPEILRDAALAAVRQWTYKPYLLNGEPVFVQTTVTVNFSLLR
jgi:TonB family protein